MDEARRQIVVATDSVTQLARGIQGTHPADTDRLLLIALGLNSDGGYIPTHVANRLYLRGQDLALTEIENNLWLRSVVADVGRAPTSATRVLPGWAVVSAGESDLLALLGDENDSVVCGVFRILQRLRRRPKSLWGDDAANAGSPAGRWAAALRRPGATRAVETYLASLAKSEDLELLDEILGADTEVSRSVQQLRDALAGDASDLAAAVAARTFEPEWKATVLSTHLSSFDDNSVGVLATGSATPTWLRDLAVAQLRSRDLLTDDVLKALIVLADVVDVIFDLVRDSSCPVTPEQISRVVTDLEKDTPTRRTLESRIRATRTITDELVSNVRSGDDPLSAWEALEWKNDGQLIDLAREIFDSDGGRPASWWDDMSSDRVDHEALLAFVRAESRRAALRILMSQTPVQAEDLIRVRTELERASLYTNQQCLKWLAEHATPNDLTLLWANLSDAHGKARDEVVEALLRVGGRDTAGRMLDLGNPDEQVRAVISEGAGLVKRGLAVGESL